jgi:hypothetical protein
MPFVIKGGEKILVSDAEALDLIRLGAAELAEGEKIRTEGGGAYAADDPVLQAGEAARVTPVSAEEEARWAEKFSREEMFGDQNLATFGEGILSGMSVSLLDPLMADYETTQRALANPYVRGGGEFVGALGPMFATGGTGAVAKAAALTPAGAVGKLGSKIAMSRTLGGGAWGSIAAATTEGAAFGAGQGVSATALSRDPFTVEALLENMWEGAKTGAAWGAAGGAVFGALAKTARGTAGKIDDSILLNRVDDKVARIEKSGLGAMDDSVIQFRQSLRAEREALEAAGKNAKQVEKLRAAESRIDDALRAAESGYQRSTVEAARPYAPDIKGLSSKAAEKVTIIEKAMIDRWRPSHALRPSEVAKNIDDFAGNTAQWYPRDLKGKAAKAAVKRRVDAFKAYADDLRTVAKQSDEPIETLSGRDIFENYSDIATAKPKPAGAGAADDAASPDVESARTRVTPRRGKDHVLHPRLHPSRIIKDAAWHIGREMGRKAVGGTGPIGRQLAASTGGVVVRDLAQAAMGRSTGLIGSILLSSKPVLGKTLKVASDVLDARIKTHAPQLPAVWKADKISDEEVDEISDSIRRMRNNPALLHDMMADKAIAADLDPEVMAMTLDQGADQFEKLSKEVPEEQEDAFGNKLRTPRYKQRELKRYIRGGMYPYQVFEDFLHGKIDMIQVRALREMHPAKHEEMSMVVYDLLRAAEGPVDKRFAKRATLFTGMPVDPLLRPEAFMEAQSLYGNKGSQGNAEMGAREGSRSVTVQSIQMTPPEPTPGQRVGNK